MGGVPGYAPFMLSALVIGLKLLVGNRPVLAHAVEL
jgi:hypothetical protein